MDHETFEDLVAAAVDSIPEPFCQFLDNVVFLVEDFADAETTADLGLAGPGELLGLYHGDPITERGVDDWGMLPDQITLFQRPIEEYSAKEGLEVVDVIRDTILHEVGHHFGFDEEALERMGLD